jgi:hypothetical protein
LKPNLVEHLDDLSDPLARGIDLAHGGFHFLQGGIGCEESNIEFIEVFQVRAELFSDGLQPPSLRTLPPEPHRVESQQQPFCRFIERGRFSDLVPADFGQVD